MGKLTRRIANSQSPLIIKFHEFILPTYKQFSIKAHNIAFSGMDPSTDVKNALLKNILNEQLLKLNPETNLWLFLSRMFRLPIQE